MATDATSTTRHAILVLGMHRSGTSAITRVLSLLGAELPRRLLEPVPGVNETGFWESAELVSIHDRMLAAAGSAWDDPRELPLAFFETAAAAAFADEIMAVLERDFSKSSLFVIKDPRICRFVPFWIEIIRSFGCQPLPLLLRRNPLEVGASLARRDHFDTSKSHMLWLRHVLDMELATRTLPRSLMDYESLLQDWRSAVGQASRDLGVDWPRKPEEVAPEIESFLSPALRHHSRRSSEVAADPEVPPWAQQSFAAIGQMMVDPGAREPRQVLDRVRAELDSASRAFGSLIGGQRERELERALAQRDSQLESLESRLAEAERSLEQRRQDFDRHNELLESGHASDKAIYEAEIERIRSLLEEFDRRVRSQSKTIEELDAGKQELAARAEQLERQTLEERKSNRERIEALERQTRMHEQRSRELEERIEREAALRERTARSARRLDSEKRELESALAETQAEHEETLQDKYWLYEQWQEAKAAVAALEGSRMGRSLLALWAGYIGLRNTTIRAAAALRQSPASILGGLLRFFRNGLRWLVGAALRAARGGLGMAGRGLGWMFLLVSTLGEKSAARFRRHRSIRPANRQEALPSPTSLLSAPSERRPRVLMVSPYSIHPPSHGGGVRLFNLVRRLCEPCDLHLLVFIRDQDDPAQRAALEPFAESVRFHHWQPEFGRGRLGLEAPSQRLFASDELARRLARILSEEQIDILQLEYTELGQYGLPHFSRVKVALSEIDIAFRSLARRRREGFHERFESSRAFGHTYGDWMRQLRYELQVVRRADQVQMMSHEDADYLAAYLPDGHQRLRVVPNAVDIDAYRPAGLGERDRRLLFVGNYEHLPNLDAIEHFFADIWPEILRLRPGTEIAVVGANAPRSLRRYQQLDGVEIVGEVPELAPHYRRHRVLVAPIRAGSGTRLKILEAMACGTPVISTRLGAEGIECRHERDLLIADSPVDFASAAVSTLENDALWEHLSHNCRRLVEDKYTWEASTARQLAGYEELLRASAASKPTSSALHSASPGNAPPASGRAGNGDPNARRQEQSVDISVVIPTYNGGSRLRDCLQAIAGQQTSRTVEVLCVDSGSSSEDLETMRQLGARVISIDKSEFDHGLTRDLGASSAQGEILVFLNQDAVPANGSWLSRLTDPLLADNRYAAVQGAIRELPESEGRFYWDSGGDRFYFTRESRRWLERFYGIGFSTVNAAIRRQVWREIPFGRAPIMEDKSWQRSAVERGAAILYRDDAAVLHSHDYDLRALLRRCQSEGYGWRFLGEGYSLADMSRDMMQPRIYSDLLRGLRQGRVRSGAELFFPLLRPLALYWGNHWSRGVKH